MRTGAGARYPSVRAAGALMLAGGALALTTVLLPPGPAGSELAVVVVGVVALVLGALLFGLYPRLSEPLLGLVAALGTVMITVSTQEGGASASANEVLYVWVCLYSFYFFSLPHALGQLALIGIAFALMLADSPAATDVAVTSWVVTISTLAVAGLLIARMRVSIEWLLEDLSERAHRDSLTGLMNRRALEERAAVELARARREGTPLSMVLFDIDNFKTLNDSFGHAVGDDVLRHVAGTVVDATRAVDAVARLGGDEFVVLLPGADREEAMAVAARLRGETLRRDRGDSPPATLSIGVATWPAAGDSLERLWRAADLAAYEAKRAGGNEIRFSSRAGDPPASSVTAGALRS
ncbi:MAG TPA: GGDEF domain-containing protein [Solirubrobacterales bacterium]|nr:GGDEF domain-containing protein [Solirubrobacterales bacterium]